jgi:hypothetical protein
VRIVLAIAVSLVLSGSARPAAAQTVSVSSALKDLATHPDPNIRRTAVRTLAQAGGTAAIRACSGALLLDKDATVRKDTTKALLGLLRRSTSAGDWTTALSALSAASTNDPDRYVRRWAARVHKKLARKAPKGAVVAQPAKPSSPCATPSTCPILSTSTKTQAATGTTSP